MPPSAQPASNERTGLEGRRQVNNEQLRRIFNFRMPTTQQASLQGSITATAYDLAERINETCPESREKSLALTNLQQCVQWAQAAIGLVDPGHESPAGGNPQTGKVA